MGTANVHWVFHIAFCFLSTKLGLGLGLGWVCSAWEWGSRERHGYWPQSHSLLTVLESQGGHDHGAKPGRGGVASCPVTSAMSSSLCRLGYRAHFLPLTISPGPDLCGRGGCNSLPCSSVCPWLNLLTSRQRGKKGVNHEPSMGASGG